MIDILLFCGLLLLGLGVVASVWRNARARSLARQRMESPIEVSDPSQLEPIPAARSFLVRHRFVPWMLGLLVAALMHFAFGWALPLCNCRRADCQPAGRPTGVLSSLTEDREN